MADSEVYADNFVSFTDILGFSNLVAGAGARDPKTIISIMKSHEEYFVDKPTKDQSQISWIQFSDCVVAAAGPTATSVNLLFNQLMLIAWSSLEHKVALRGGIDFGKISIEKNKVFGPAMIKAYNLESTTAKYPRIIFSTSAIKKLRSFYHAECTYRIVRDDDGCFYFDIFWPVKLYYSMISRDKPLSQSNRTYLEQNVLDKIPATIMSTINEIIDLPVVYEKWAWLYREWNKSVPASKKLPSLNQF